MVRSGHHIEKRNEITTFSRFPTYVRERRICKDNMDVAINILDSRRPTVLYHCISMQRIYGVLLIENQDCVSYPFLRQLSVKSVLTLISENGVST